MKKDIRIVTPLVTEGYRDLDASLRYLERDDLQLSHSQIEQGSACIEGGFDEALSVPATIGKIIEAERDGVDAVVIDCLGDPALAEGRECVSIPVVGPCETSMHLAAMLGYKFSVVTVLEEAIKVFEELANKYALGSKLASVRSVDIPVLELEQDLERTQKRMVEESIRAIREDRSHAIMFGCTGMTGCVEAVSKGLSDQGYNIPVIDPLPTAVLMAATLVDAGLTHSKTTYPNPRVKPISGYQFIPSLSPAK